MPMAARRRKVHSTPFPPSGENCVCSLAPPLPGEPASLGFVGSNEGLGKTPPGTAPDEHFVLIVAYPTPFVASRHLPLTGGVGPRSPVTRVTLWAGQNISGAQNLSGWSESPPGHWALSLQKFPPVRFHSRAWLCRANAPGPNPGGRMLCAPTGFRWTVWAAIRRPPWRFPPPRRGGPTWPPAGGETSLPLTPPSVPSPAPDPGTRSHGWRGPRTGPRR